MKRAIFLAFCCAALAACNRGSSGSGPLVESECREIQQKANDLVTAHTGIDVASVDIGPSDDESIDRCVAGQTFDREDYECMMAASSTSDMNECMVQTMQHMGG